ncbi:MAG: hypothetical protein ACLFNT_03155 [Spirochaetales bacterium]
MSGGRLADVARAKLQVKLLTLIDTLPAVHVQNRLMACTDRDLALALAHLEAGEVARVTDRLSARKAERVLSEIFVEERRHVEDRYRVMSLQAVIGSLEQDRIVSSTRSYHRPRRT